MYQQELLTRELHLQLSPYDLERLEIDTKESERNGHIGTHIDCYMKAPRQKEYIVDATVVDCRHGMPDESRFHGMDIGGKALVLYIGNTAANGYATRDFFMYDMGMERSALQTILTNKPRFILIDSHGLGLFSQHRMFDLECEKNDCFLIMCLLLQGEEILDVKKLKIEIDLDIASTGKPCRVFPF